MPKVHSTFSQTRIQILILGLIILAGFSLIAASPSTYWSDPHSRGEVLLETSYLPNSTTTPQPTFVEKLEDTSPAISSPTPTEVVEPYVPLPIYLPLLFNQIPPTPTPTNTPEPQISPTTRLYCNSPKISIPDNDPTGINNKIQINDPGYIMDLDVKLDVSHSWVGDLIFTLSHPDTDTKISLIDKPGYPVSANGCDQDGINTILDDEISSPVENKCSTSPLAISGIYQPQENLSDFIGQNISGTWKLTVSDNYIADTGTLNQWCLAVKTNPFPINPTPDPTIEPPPSSAQIDGITGQPQSMPLDCESRSAVDWAAYYGKNINEINFFNQLPKSNHPDIGFVGDPYDTWGQIPPDSYGVHAEPVADLLREYGVKAYAHRHLGWDGLKAEIASGNPVIVWIVGSIINGIPSYYSTNNGPLTIVARFEHTVIVTGYTQNRITYLNGGYIYTRGLEQFLDSWSVMQEMAVTFHP